MVNFGSLIKALIPLAIVVAIMFGIAVFILPMSGLTGSLSSLFPACISGGYLLLVIIPFIIFGILFKKAIDLSKRAMNAIN